MDKDVSVTLPALPDLPFVTGAGEGDDFNTPRRWATGPAEGDDERMLLNVGGVRHETHVSTLRAIPNSRLSRLAELHVQSGGGPQEYFFDRHPSVFNAIIDFYRTGELHVPLEVCGAVVKRELDFWQIDEMEIKACCWRHYRSYIENQAILDSFNHSLEKENVHVDLDSLKGWRRLQWKVWLVLEYPRTSRAAMIYGVTSFLFVVTSIAGFCLETLPGWRPVRVAPNSTNQTACGDDSSDAQENGKSRLAPMTNLESLYVLDVICTVFFTLELVLRFIFAPSKWRFVFSLMNVIDLLALVPLYVTVIFQSSTLQSCYLNERFVIEIMFILRIIRMFRIFHLVKHYQALKVLVYALKASLQELLMLFIFLLIGMLVFSTMIYYAERKDATSPGDMFSTIPMGFWWSIITMTTVGYGDVYPTSTIGYIVGTACSVCGVLMVALTIPVISNNFTLFYRHVRSRSIIPRSKGGEADSQIDIPETVRPVRKASLASNDGGPILNGHVSGMSHMFVPAAGFQQANSMNNIVMPKSDSDLNLIRSRSVKAHSDDGVMYRTEAFV
ncbi:potassium voltage-gated channel protein Shaw-like [Babylonia areolata]|uniref:potassium voltage-gated channel protein Shaw-like n=1 Tax=Babylonia areolata TaxID=304850 RepID=UPI003FD0E68A